MSDVRCDVLVVGGSLGGVAAAERAAAMKQHVVLLTEDEWIGGQFTAQGVCTPDENQWIATVGSTRAYRQFRLSLTQHYSQRYELSAVAEKLPVSQLNVGDCWVNQGSTAGIGFAVEPRVARDQLYQRLRRFPHLTLCPNAHPVAAEVQDGRVTAVVAEAPGHAPVRYSASYVLDATDLGDLLPLAGLDFVIGAESCLDTGEPPAYAPVEPRPDWVQPFTFPFALECRPNGEDYTIEPPDDYEALKQLQDYRLQDGAIRTMFQEPAMWTYRRFIHAANFCDGSFPYDLSMINTDSIDFQGGSVPSDCPKKDAERRARGRQAALGYVYWLQTQCPRDDNPGQLGYPELRLREDVFDTPDGIARRPYVRESRRIKALVRVVLQDIVAGSNDPRARLFRDSCGIGHYSIDIHAGGQGRQRFIGFETRPFQIPLGALIPADVSNLLAASKNLGVTHLTNGAYRVHPVEWNIGESAGALAAFCNKQGVTPHEVHRDPCLLLAYQRRLLAHGISLFWWTDVPDGHGAFAATQLLGVHGVLSGGSDLRFQPDDPLTPEAVATVEARLGRCLKWPGTGMNRAAAAMWLARELQLTGAEGH